MIRLDCEIQDVKLGLVKFIDHETHDLFALLSHHADAVTLAKTAKEVFLRPGVIKTFLFRLEYFGHVAPDHPPNMNANLFFLGTSCTHGTDTSPRHVRAELPIGGCTTLPAYVPNEFGGNRRDGWGML